MNATDRPLLQRILVWDMPTRVFHWSLAGCFTIAWLTAESEPYAAVHQIAGYLFAALIAFRLVWGLAGSRYARFAEFLRSPREIARYAAGYVRRAPAHYIGHNPLGALAIVLMLVLGIGIAVTGWLNATGGESFEEIHEVFANGMLVVIFVHIAGVIASSLMHRENLAEAMVTGYKNGPESAGIRRSHGIIALLLIAALGFFAWSLYQGKLPTLLDPGVMSATQGEHGENDKDDD